MKLENLTARAAAYLPTGSPTSPRHLLGCVVAREVYRVDREGLAVVDDGPRWPVGPVHAPTPLGTFPGDKPFHGSGVAVLLGGRVHAPGGIPTQRIDVEIEVGRTFRRRIAVFGDRTWIRAEGATVPGPPKLFGVMRLHPSRAFGGVARGPDGRDVPEPANPEGRGFFLDEDDAVGGLLPNLEHPDRLVARPRDRPPPVGVGYLGAEGALRAAASVDLPVGDALLAPGDLRPSIFDHAHPEWVIEPWKAPAPGDVIRVSHGRRGGEDLVVQIPDRPCHLFVQLEGRGFSLPLVLDQIAIAAGDERLMLGWRVVFDVPLVRGERRWLTLRDGPAPTSIPDGYRRSLVDDWDGAWRPSRPGDPEP